ncbi:MAG: hypothetical protein J0I29_04535 [Rhizobiales bacterium]|nr:hypothetical protein [Hyphomicrobiales bacterium]
MSDRRICHRICLGLFAALALLCAASISVSAQTLSCDALKGDCLERGINANVCGRNYASAHLTGKWPAFRRGNLVIPARACK